MDNVYLYGLSFQIAPEMSFPSFRVKNAAALRAAFDEFGAFTEALPLEIRLLDARTAFEIDAYNAARK